MKENKKLALFEAIASLMAVVAIIGCATTAYSEGTDVSLTMFELIFGSSRTDPNFFVILGFGLLVVSALISATAAAMLFFEKIHKDIVTMLFGVTGGAFALIGGILVGTAILLTGLDKQNSELGLIQGNWSLGTADFLVPLSALASLILSYPTALIMAHHADLKDKGKKDKGENQNKANV